MIRVKNSKVEAIGKTGEILSELCLAVQSILSSDDDFDTPQSRSIVIYSALGHKSHEEIEEIMEELKKTIVCIEKLNNKSED